MQEIKLENKFIGVGAVAGFSDTPTANWEVTIQYGERLPVTFYYHMGLGLIEECKNRLERIVAMFKPNAPAVWSKTYDVRYDVNSGKFKPAQGRQVTLYDLERMNPAGNFKTYRLAHPDLSGVLCSLQMDYNSWRDSVDFHGFCSELGYDNDSIKAKGVWDAVCENAAKVRRLFGSDLEEFLEVNYDA